MRMKFKKLCEVTPNSWRCEFHYPQSDNSVRVEHVDPIEIYGLQSHIDALTTQLTQAHKDIFAARGGNRDLVEKNEQLVKEIFDWKQGSGVEARLGDEARREVAELKRELAVARERLGPAGYKIISEVSMVRGERDAWRERHTDLKAALEHYQFPRHMGCSPSGASHDDPSWCNEQCGDYGKRARKALDKDAEYDK